MKGHMSSPKAAYETFPGVTAEEAADKGLVIVECGPDGGTPVYGRYLDTATGAALETLRTKDDREPVAIGGSVFGVVGTANKGSLLNVNDPVVHGTTDNNPHEDGAQPNDSENADLNLEGYTPGDDLKPSKRTPPKA